jgi:hypothetical protein
MKIQLSHTQELLTPRSGMIMCHSFVEHHQIAKLVDQYFPKPGSNRSYPHSSYVNAFLYLCFDGASNLEDVNCLRENKAFVKAVQMKQCPSAGKLVHHGNRIKLKIASTIDSFSIIEQTYLHYLLAPS